MKKIYEAPKYELIEALCNDYCVGGVSGATGNDSYSDNSGEADDILG